MSQTGLAEKGEFAVVLTVFVMPTMDGANVAAALRAIDPALPILSVTGHADRQRLIDEHVIDKTFAPRTLAEAASRMLAPTAS